MNSLEQTLEAIFFCMDRIPSRGWNRIPSRGGLATVQKQPECRAIRPKLRFNLKAKHHELTSRLFIIIGIGTVLRLKRQRLLNHDFPRIHILHRIRSTEPMKRQNPLHIRSRQAV